MIVFFKYINVIISINLYDLIKIIKKKGAIY